MTTMTTKPTWTAEVYQEQKIVPIEKKDGSKGVVVVTVTRIFLLRDNHGICFKVGRGRNGVPVITDEREQLTGWCGATNRQYQTEPYTKGGPVRKLTPTGWVTEVTRLIGESRAREVIAEIS